SCLLYGHKCSFLCPLKCCKIKTTCYTIHIISYIIILSSPFTLFLFFICYCDFSFLSYISLCKV
ncbi:unnamed protein product, partial [Cochlearia groenlandica]